MIARGALSVRECSKCRATLLNTFASFAGLSFPSTPRRQTKYSAERGVILSLRSPACHSPYSSLVQQSDHDGSLEDGQVREASNVSDNSRPSDPSIPWYLQINPPQPTVSPISERQQLPALPTDPPPLLQPFLEHLSVEIGLDDLTLFDLRHLDPPPALGANLIMVLGTTRSEKHLHVSADRFCRWLRTTHKLSPYADGLLGRNELKIKLRRKNKRAKLLGSFRTSEDKNHDDGMSTGWVCVNVGAIEEANATGEEIPEVDGFVGFGVNPGGTRLVVQMLTEEKREELDLETLWGGFLARQQRKEARDEQQGDTETNVVGHSISGARLPVADALLSVNHDRLVRGLHHAAGTRAFHTSSRNCTDDIGDPATAQHDAVGVQALESMMKLPDFIAEKLAANVVDESQPSHKPAELQALEAHINHLQQLPKNAAIEHLGIDAHDRGSTPFLASFYAQIPLFPTLEHWQHRFQLVGYAYEVDHPGYTKADVLDIVQEMQSSAIDVPMEIYKKTLSIIPPDGSSGEVTGGAVSSATDLATFITHLEHSALRGHDAILTEPICLQLFLAVVQARSVHHNPADRAPQVRDDAIRRLTQLMDRHSLSFISAQSRFRILQALASSGDWPEFWRFWRAMARRMQRKPAILYAAMFEGVAGSGHQAMCVEALHTWIAEMEIEEPPVGLVGGVARAVMGCVEVAEPDVGVLVREGVEGNEWVRVWRRCQRGLWRGKSVVEEEVDGGFDGAEGRGWMDGRLKGGGTGGRGDGVGVGSAGSVRRDDAGGG